MDKDELKIFVKEKKPLLLAIAGAVVILILVICIFLALKGRDSSGESVDPGAWITVEELEASGPDFLPEDPAQVQAITDTASEILSELSAAGGDRETMIRTLRDAILGLDYGLTEEEAQELSQWLVDYYLEKVESVQDNSQTAAGTESDLGQLQADLQEMADYLEQLDASVTYNKEELQNLTTVQGDSLDTIQEYLDNLKAEISVLKEEFSSYESTDTSHLEESVNTGITNISSLLGTLYESIANTQNEILVKLADSGLETGEKYEEINNRLGDLTVSINQNLEEIDDHISSVLDDLMADNDEQNREFIKQLQSTQEQVTTLISEFAQENALQLTRMEENSAARYESLTQTLTEVHNAITAALEEMRAENSEQNAALVEQLQTMKAELDAVLGQLSEENEAYYTSLVETLTKMNGDLNGLLEEMKAENTEQNAALQELIRTSADGLRSMLETLQQSGEEWYNGTNSNINTKVAELMNNLDGIHNNITSTQLDIRQTLVDMQTADAQRMNQIMEEFYGITADLAAINTSMDTAHGEIKTLITEVETSLKNEADENQSELLGALTEMDSSFEQANSEGFQNLLNSLQAQAENMQSQFDALNSSMTANTSAINQTAETNKTEVLNKLASMESSINNTVNNIGTGTSVSQEAILERIGQMEENTNNRLSGLSGDIQSVFQRVSNGKALLASALLTKDVVIDEDATFQEIHDAILSIEQEVVIGVDKLPGTIEYEYHYHTGDAQNGGGCYTVEDVHHHNAGCYQLCTYSWTGCEGSTGWTDGNSISHCPYRETHSICNGGQTMYKTYDHYNGGGSQSGHRSGGSSTHAILVCGKTEGQHYGWATGCGLQDGQIIGAHIVYDADAVSAAAATYRKEAADENALAMEKLEELLNALEQETAAGVVEIPEEDPDSALTEETEAETESQAEPETEEEETESEALPEEGTESGTGEETEPETETEEENESSETEKPEDGSEAAEETESETGTDVTETEEGEAETTEEASETPAAEEPSAAPEEPAGEEGTAAGEESQAEEEKEEDKAGGEALKEEPPAVQEETSFTARREYKAGKNSAAQKGKMLLPAGYALAS